MTRVYNREPGSGEFRIKNCASPINITNANNPAGCQKRPESPRRKRGS
jgi:hypothetical protein